ncbi:NADH-quinone oxidoreductase subunit K [Rubrimonas cliftonensis]|uniref:Multisubunit sodium/proton antiporter, MrpC subunit n=1 Tax=Rubrimonas cliftonensis TaxID=89524 RepID=A0A1H4D4E7_9RHOB|nr:NADH-quinone oxidoreductase subunit K [Rubrimonas cliftonensis]SEA67172.1 multisubunit sodium/proton antiporter, MrpC subunit [Rubrimonas cliftonensis]
MEPVLALTVGVLAACGVWLMLARHLLRFVLGLTLLGAAANLSVFTAGRVTADAAPLIPEGAIALEGAAANPLPQALVLTAIVIGFGLSAFALALALAAQKRLGGVDPETMRVAEPVKGSSGRGDAA